MIKISGNVENIRRKKLLNFDVARRAQTAAKLHHNMWRSVKSLMEIRKMITKFMIKSLFDA